MAEEYRLSQNQSEVLEKVISSTVKNDGKSFSSEDLGIIKHIISPEDLETLRRIFAVIREVTEDNYNNESFSYSDIDSGIDQIEEGRLSLEFECEALMGATENIFHHSLFGGENEIDGSPRSAEGLEVDSNIKQTVYELYWEMISRCACGVDDAHEVSLALLDSICGYSWVAQVVLVVAAFAIHFGEFWLTLEVEPLLPRDPLSQSVCLLKRLDCLLEITDSMKIGLESLKNLVERIWDLTKLFVKYEDNLTRYSGSFPEVHLVGYEIVYGVVTCISHNIALVRMNREYTTLAIEVQQMRSSLERLAYLQSYVNARTGYYTGVTRHRRWTADGDSYEDIAKFISRLISQTGKLVLGHPSTKGKVTLKKLKGNRIALFISDFEVQKEEFSSLIKTHKALNNNPNTNFEVVWIPMMVGQSSSTTWTEDNKRRVSSMGASMPWYWVWDPSTINISFLQRVKQKWHFQGKPILVILDKTGKITHTNALPMTELWGPAAYPFTMKDEKQLQEGLSHAIDLMFSANEPNKEKYWAEEGKIICFYGSHNEDWIRKFLQKMESIKVQITSFEMEIIYVGTNKKQEELPRILTAIKDINNNCRAWSEERILSFWHNLKKKTCPKMTKVDFSTRKEFVNIINYDEDEDGWALILGDPKQQEVIKSSGTKLMECLDRFTTWGSGIQGPKDFVRELNKEVRVRHSPEHCKGMMVPTTTDGPVWMHCVECGHFMD